MPDSPKPQRESETLLEHIQVEITDPAEPHCFRLLLHPKAHGDGCQAVLQPGRECTCEAGGSGARLEIMLHARSVVELIHKLSLAYCDWAADRAGFLYERLNHASSAAYRDDRCAERRCDHCGTSYRGPAVYCSLGCALLDAR
jgi:hypothetical protein